jgi:hypothetical protein
VHYGAHGWEVGSPNPEIDAKANMFGFFAAGTVLLGSYIAIDIIATNVALTASIPAGAPAGSTWIQIGQLGWQLARPAAALAPSAPLLLQVR